MRTNGADHIGRSANAAIEGEVFAHDPQAHRTPGLQIFRDKDRLPEHPEQATRQRSGSDGQKVFVSRPLCYPGKTLGIQLRYTRGRGLVVHPFLPNFYFAEIMARLPGSRNGFLSHRKTALASAPR